MKHIDISHDVMKAVSVYEQKRSRSYLWRVFFILWILVVIGIVGCIYIGNRLYDQDTFSLLELFSQDIEIIRDYWRDTLSIFFTELPIWPSVLSILLITCIVGIGIFSWKKITVSFRRLHTLSMARSSKKSNTYLLPLFVFLGIGVVAILFFGVYLGSSTASIHETNMMQQQQQPAVSPEDTLAPQSPVSSGLTVTLSSPANGATVTTKTVTINGSTSPRAEVFVNDKDLRADAKGNFSVSLSLDEGENIISVAANDDIGNFATQEIIVTYEPAS